mmetsp:Transcript_37541/g.74540  ORF Transcript_37541/g.74540 Transcript_37541/m.74540 type:complete len:291 (+) Transcript_37541:69-941(+)
MTIPLLWPLLQKGWAGYSADEKKEHYRKLVIDVISFPFCGLWYCFLASLVLPGSAAGETSAADFERTTSQCVVQAILAVAAVYALMMNIIGMPGTTADSDAHRAQSAALGKWIYLTRHGLALQAWHQILSLASVVSPQLNLMTHGATLWVAAFGWFICIQYFVMVVPSQACQEEFALWKSRGLDFEGIDFLVHAPALPIALLDVAYAKSAPLLRAAVDSSRIYCFLPGYIVFYLCVITWNHRRVGVWPYGLMRALGTSVSKWAMFLCTQTLVMITFATLNLFLIFLRTRR